MALPQGPRSHFRAGQAPPLRCPGAEYGIPILDNFIKNNTLQSLPLIRHGVPPRHLAALSKSMIWATAPSPKSIGTDFGRPCGNMRGLQGTPVNESEKGITAKGPRSGLSWGCDGTAEWCEKRTQGRFEHSAARDGAANHERLRPTALPKGEGKEVKLLRKKIRIRQ